ncbi:hypothetical protein C8R45DRAFT_1165254 [Mycena sanguinolenta]|nr:hypothetical protein C8R45DRAFT_1165254 [Mycena sanguinolenta]
MRNCFISEYILRTTGKTRSAKQVGSRLQQIRESCRDEKLLRLLSPIRQPTHTAAFVSTNGFCSPSDSSSNPPSTNISFIRHTVVHINILPEGATGSETNQIWMEDEVSARPPRCLSSINPTVAFTASSLIEAESRFAVYAAGRLVHSETTQLVLAASRQTPGFIYSTPLVPKYWQVISRSCDPTRFTLHQKVFKSVDSESVLIFSGTYTLRYPAESFPVLPPPVDIHNSEIDPLVSDAPTRQFQGDRYPLYFPRSGDPPATYFP